MSYEDLGGPGGDVQGQESIGEVTSAPENFDPDARIDQPEETEAPAETFDPDARIEQPEIVGEPVDTFDPDARIEASEPAEMNDPIESAEVATEKNEPEQQLETEAKPEVLSNVELYNSPEKREQLALSSNGEWRGEPGKSEFVPNSQEARDKLEEYGVDSISYDENCEPDLRPVSEATVEIDNMSDKRLGPGGNYEQAFDKLSQRYNEESKDGRTDWSKRDIDQWRQDHDLTPHERMDRKTVDFVPTAIHKECKHCGGCSECKARDQIGGGFDE